MTTFSRLLLYGKGTKQAAIGIELRGLAEAHQSLKKLTCRLVLKYILEPKNNLNFLGTFFFFFSNKSRCGRGITIQNFNPIQLGALAFINNLQHTKIKEAEESGD